MNLTKSPTTKSEKGKYLFFTQISQHSRKYITAITLDSQDANLVGAQKRNSVVATKSASISRKSVMESFTV